MVGWGGGEGGGVVPGGRAGGGRAPDFTLHWLPALCSEHSRAGAGLLTSSCLHALGSQRSRVQKVQEEGVGEGRGPASARAPPPLPGPIKKLAVLPAPPPARGSMSMGALEHANKSPGRAGPRAAAPLLRVCLRACPKGRPEGLCEHDPC